MARKYALELRQIDMDINRTFRNNFAYKRRYCQRYIRIYTHVCSLARSFCCWVSIQFKFFIVDGDVQRQNQLYNILAAYSIYNTEIGYCQGMSTLTAFLLMYLSDEEVRLLCSESSEIELD